MNRARLAFGLAGFAAAVAISTLGHAPSAPARESHATKVECSAGGHAGQAVQKTEFLKVNDKRLSAGRVYLRRGDRLRTTSRGTATICLQAGGATCRLEAGTRIRVLPSGNALASLSEGSITCKMRALTRTWDFETKTQLVRFGSHTSASLLHHGAAPTGAGHLFSITFRRAGATVKVRRGATIVALQGRLSSGVVVGRQEQVVAQGAQDPRQPAPIRLTTKERRAFAQLQALLPPVRDNTPPGVQIASGPRNPSSTRMPRFAFSASEPTAILSCSVDGGAFRLCLPSQRFGPLDPGPHRLAVAATDATGNVSPPSLFAWTIDASRIVFATTRHGNREIYVMDPDGRSEKRLTNEPGEDGAPAWSPDGRQIAFHTERDGNFEIYVMNADGSNQHAVTKNGSFDKNPTWSPDGREIVFESARDGNSELYVVTADGTRVRRLTNDPAVDFDPAWSPDGTRIAFASTRRGGNYDIYVMGADGSNPTVLAPDPAIDFNPAWSPNSKTIAFHSDRDRESSQIYVMNADGTGLTRLSFTRANDFNPVWAPDGAELAFQSSLHGNDDIYIISADGSDLTQLTQDTSADLVPDW